MKQLFVVRHAKSSWENPGQSDFDRALNERGLKDAPMMAKRLQLQGIFPDAIVSSPAVRALTTARFFAAQFGLGKNEIVQVDRLYHASVDTFYDVISNEFLDAWDRVFLFSHNPGITYFVNSIGVAELDNMPTCGIFGVRANIGQWKDFGEAEKRFILFDYPKNTF